MTMFEELFALACGATLAMTVSADEKSGLLTLNVIPKPKQDAGDAALTRPLSLTATPQEFDAGFIEALRGYREARRSLAQQAEATKEVIEAARTASVQKASEATAKAAAPRPSPAKPAAAAAPPSATADLESDDADDAPATDAAAGTTGSGDSLDLFG